MGLGHSEAGTQWDCVTVGLGYDRNGTQWDLGHSGTATQGGGPVPATSWFTGLLTAILPLVRGCANHRLQQEARYTVASRTYYANYIITGSPRSNCETTVPGKNVTSR